MNKKSLQQEAAKLPGDHYQIAFSSNEGATRATIDLTSTIPMNKGDVVCAIVDWLHEFVKDETAN